MKILLLADIHGYENELKEILKGPFNEIDLVICAGDLTDMYRIPEGFSQADMVDTILQKMFVLNKPLLCIPGNHDPYESIDVFESYGVNLHNKIRKIKGIEFLGFGGAETPFNTIFEPTEQEIEKSLAKHKPTPSNFILVVHQPPKNTKQDRLSTGQHAGSAVIRKYILEKQPMLATSGHIHEGQGVDYLNKTVLFNPGPVFEGKYGIIDIEDKKVTCKVKTAALAGK